MSYISGFMLGTALGESLHRMASPKLKAKPRRSAEFKLVSVQKGRRRYRVGSLSPELARILEEKLSKLEFINDVRTNPQTGSILFTHKGSEKQMDALAAYLKAFVFRNAGKKDRIKRSKQGNVTKSIRGTAGAISRWLKRNSGNNMDLTSAVSLLFIVLGIRELIKLKETPAGYQMLWWAVSLFRGWRD